MEKRIPARALIECILCAKCGQYATATGGGICAACALTAERDQLRAELIKVLRFVGGQATEDVSTAFLLNVSEEVSSVLAGMAQVTADLRTEVERLRGETTIRNVMELDIASRMGAEALEFVEWLFGVDEHGWMRFGRLYCSGKHQGYPSFEAYARSEWEKERRP